MVCHHVRKSNVQEFDGEGWNPISFDSEGTLLDSFQVPENHSYSSVKRIFTLGFLHLRRKSVLTPQSCYHLRWGIGFGNGSEQIDENVKRQRKRAIFLKQNFLTNRDWRLRWGIMRRDIPTELLENRWHVFKCFKRLQGSNRSLTSGNQSARAAVANEMNKLEEWLRVEYPDINVNVHRMPHKLGYSYLISGIFLQLVVTSLLGALTKFQLGSRSHAPWFLVWIYGGPMLRWKWLNDESFDKEPCLSARKWIFFGITSILSLALAVAVFGGISSLCVELLGSICNREFTFSAPVWLLIAGLIALAFAVIGFSVTYFSWFASKD